jgi:mannosyltransferase OCH1-like enzyme
MIPKIIHQVWLGPNQIPEELMKYRMSVFGKNSSVNWKHYLWTETHRVENMEKYDDTIQFEYKHIDELGAGNLLKECDSLAAQSDVVRLLAIAKYGGIYLDMDVECLKELSPLLFVSGFAARENNENICNAVFGACSHHPNIVSQIKELPYNVYKPTTWGVELFTKHVLPCESGFTLFPTHMFYPYLWDMPKEYQNVHSESFCIHHWKASWNK